MAVRRKFSHYLILWCNNINIINLNLKRNNVKHQRDVNATKNIKRVGASTLAGEVVRATSVV